MPGPSESTVSSRVLDEISQVLQHELLRCIGRGSYGEVWLGRNVMGGYRAVKILQRAEHEADRRLQRESAGLRKFEPISRRFDGYVDVLHIGQNAHSFYYVMELADDAERGREIHPPSYAPKTLAAELARRGRLPQSECLDLGIALAETLADLHGHGLVHRDIKPSNIIYIEGKPKLADVGLVADDRATGSFVGTRGFVPPEGPGTASADLYSLGMVLYEVATGRDRLEFPLLPEDLSEMPDREPFMEVNEILLKACATHPGTRYKGASELLADLKRVKRGESLQRLRRDEKRIRRLSKFALVVTLIAALALGGYGLARRGQNQALDRLVRFDIAQGNQLVEEGDYFGALLWFAEASRIEQDPDRRPLHELRIQSILDHAPKLGQLVVHEGFLHHASLNRSGSLLVTAGADGTARLWSTDNGQLRIPALRHPDEVFTAAFDPAGDRLATGCKDGLVRLWNCATGEQVAKPLLLGGTILRIEFGADGRWIGAASREGKARVWNAGSREPVSPELQIPGALDAMEFAPDGHALLTAGTDGIVRLWHELSDEPRCLEFAHSSRVRSAHFSPRGDQIVTGCEDGTVRIWKPAVERKDGFPAVQSFGGWKAAVPGAGQLSSSESTPELADLKSLEFLAAHQGPVLTAGFSPDGTLVATASKDGTARLWDSATGQAKGKTLQHDDQVRWASFSPDGRWLLTACSDQTVRVWNVATGERLRPIFKRNTSIVAAEFSAGGGKLLVAARHDCVFLWELALKTDAWPVLRHEGPVVDAGFSPDSRWLATASADHTARIWDVQTGKPAGSPLRHAHNVTQVAFSPDGRLLATASADRTAGLWDVPSGRPSRMFQHEGGVSSVVFSRDGRWLATTTGESERAARIWDLASGQLTGGPWKHRWGINSASFSPDGESLVTASGDLDGREEGEIRFWRTASQQPGLIIREPGAFVSVQFLGDGTRFVTGSSDFSMQPRSAQIWLHASGKPAGPSLNHLDGVVSARFDLAGDRVATASEDETARVWNVRTSAAITPPLRHRRQVRDAAFSPDGRLLVTACEDGTARLWDARTGEPVGVPLEHGGPVVRAAFSPDGAWLVTASSDGTARLWRVDPASHLGESTASLAQVASGRRFATTGGIESVPPAVAAALWRDLGQVRE